MSLRPLHVLLLALVAILTVGGGCARKHQVRPSGVQTAARQGYLDGLLETQDGNFVESVRHFQTVAASPRYFRYTALAALRAADALYYQEAYGQALEAYMGFIKRYAGNPNVPYAEFRVVQCHFERLPGDWFILPPSHERDLATTRAAYDAARRFLTQRPRHRFAPQASRIRDFCAARLYDNHLYVAGFYASRDKPAGVAQRLEWALAEFPELATTESNVLRLAEAYQAAGDAQGAMASLRRYLDEFPEGARRGDVSAWLSDLEIETAPEEKRDDEPVEDAGA